MKTKNILSAVSYLFVIQVLSQWSGVMLAQCYNSPAGVWGSPGNFIGIKTTNPQKPLHIFSSNICNESAIRLEYQGIPPYWGHLALICPNNLSYYSSIGLAR